MFLFRRLIPFLISAGSAFFVFLFIRQPESLLGLWGSSGINDSFIGIIIGAHLAMISLGMLAIGAFHPITSRLRFLLFPLFLTTSTYILLSFSEKPGIIFALAALLVGMLWLWFESLYTFWQQPAAYTPYTLQRLSLPLYTLALFIAITALGGIHIYLQMRLWGIIVIAGILLLYLMYDAFALLHMAADQALITTSLGAVLALEIFAVINALPGQIYVGALLMSLFFYVFVGVCRLWAQGELKRSYVTPYVVVASLGFFLTLSSTLWII